MNTQPTCDATMSPIPISISSVDTLCVELPSPLNTLDMPTRLMPTCRCAERKRAEGACVHNGASVSRDGNTRESHLNDKQVAKWWSPAG